MYRSLRRHLSPEPFRPMTDRVRSVMPGLLTAVVIAMAAAFLSDNYSGPVMLFALLLGIAFNFLSTESACKPGIDFASRTVLRLGVALLGVRITLSDAMALGPTPLILAVLGVATTIGAGIVLARLLGFDRLFGVLTGGAVGICGASAALAIASVLPRRADGGESDTIFTVVMVTTLSTVAMVVYPVLLQQGPFTDIQSGIFLGATIHDVAQVVGAGYSISTDAGDAATLTKLLRVAMLVPVVLVISILVSRGRGEGRVGLPGFLVGFVALVIVNSLGLVPGVVATFLSDLSRWALVAAIAALGMKTMLGQIATVGPRALVLVLLETVWIALLGLAVIACR
ncbi:YeiH family protein [Aureimonas frigidaquae]|uniref:Putative membrane protein n=1 Tax=Aureimonas frigidaquae TaxID=424757 RepID=A0A0N7KXN6_9HYPH|nr:YeiH family protein [Aureimonas frigidaquae]BAT27425.1 putative membrane protein [Aureimonas frigidaquae]